MIDAAVQAALPAEVEANVNKRGTIAMVAGEASGDLLASLLLEGLHARLGDSVEFAGIGGRRMQAQGFVSHWPMETLSVNGYVEVLGSLREILATRRAIREQLLAQPPLCFIGVDAPDFNFGLEVPLRRAGIPVVHFVSPSIWAWRAGRIRTIARAVDHILCLFPFEPEIYAKAGIPATYVGHPLADVIPMVPDVAGARAKLGLPEGKRIVAVLPGSRQSEVRNLGATFFDAMARMQRMDGNLAFVLPAANAALREIVQELHARYPEIALTIVDGQSHLAMESSDVVLLASGTATLEAALYKKPMVISYKVPWLTAQIMKRQGYLPYVGLPNILSGRFVVPELLQDDATPEALARETLLQLNDEGNIAFLREHFTAMHETLKRDTANLAAGVVVDLMRARGVR
ncbi:MAG: lipid-A-disaccharide synthase [Cupriavidus sp.]|uniref:lipid-A-disaccharide synthase n=1 Tax=Cupriavidus pauculus TaxID=82633 RepID=UPI000C625509|nr:lipid-A-disaccharide synthase [Cupriavidus pauculus]KAB0605331.1 lipid-A-disaccharide synthase [Cupriavidus pauculus]MBU66817.1 lipid-A-disaccharide synthase [Cupriavidus sp.]MCM3605244.1 lipid-A-disaccharide synthase [Cupriavidus pauculus]UAK99695.1 lipid-A-disaccharide synthase [Cupriavidus pauculus]